MHYGTLIICSLLHHWILYIGTNIVQESGRNSLLGHSRVALMHEIHPCSGIIVGVKDRLGTKNIDQRCECSIIMNSYTYYALLHAANLACSLLVGNPVARYPIPHSSAQTTPWCSSCCCRRCCSLALPRSLDP